MRGCNCRHGGVCGLLGVAVLLGGGRPAEAQRPTTEAQKQAEEILQRKDASLRRMRLDALLAILQDAAAPPASQKESLGVLLRVRDVPFERAPFLAAAKPLLASPDEQVRAAALVALPGLNAGEADLPAMAKLADDPAGAVREGVVGSLFFAKGAGNPALVGPIVEKLLADPDPKVKLATLNALWGNPVSPAAEAQIIALSRETTAGLSGSLGYDAVYYALSTRPVVRLPVATRLAELMHDPNLDPNIRWRAAWGLAHTAAPEAVDAMVAALITELDETLQPQVRSYAVQGLAAHRTPAALAKLREMAEKEENPRLRAEAARAVQ